MGNKFTRFLLWVAAVGFLAFALFFFPSFSSLLLLLLVCLIAPIPKVQDFWKSRGLRGKAHVLLAFAVYIAALVAMPKDAPEAPEADGAVEKVEAVDEMPDMKIYEYDALQSLFMRLSLDTTMEQFQAMVEESGLPYTTREYNTSRNEGDEKGKIKYQVAYTEGSARQSRADSGDYLTADFGKTSSKIMTAEYVKSASIEHTALLYNFGYWYDFHGNPGYYVVLPGGVKTQYTEYDSAEEVIQKLIDKWQGKQASNTQTTPETASAEESSFDETAF